MVKRTIPFSEQHRTTARLKRLEEKLELTCAACGTTAGYSVGSVRIDLDPDDRSIADRVSFTGCFRCTTCDSIGPWELPVATQAILLAFPARLPERATRSPAVLELRTFDHSRDDGWEELVSQVLREPRHDRRRRGRRVPFLSPTRNGPCPCGSGRKFKNCCDRR